jgi:hypothetical protein
MRRIASLRLILTLSPFALTTVALSGCGYKTWDKLPFYSGANVNAPVSDSENMRRVMGEPVEVPPLTPEPGDVWPGPIKPEPTLQDLENGGLASQPEQPVPGSPNTLRGNPQVAPNPAPGSSTSPGAPPLQLNTPPTARTTPPSALVTPNRRPPAGQTYQTPAGNTGVTTGGGTNYQSTVTPGGGSAIVVPNGNGTSTVIHSDGTIETVTSPK